MKITNLRIIGSGLIGTSIALKATELGFKVELLDSDLSAENLARDLIAQGESNLEPDLVIIATPPTSRMAILSREYKANPSATFIDVASVMNDLQVQVEALTGLFPNFIQTHPIAGREISGAKGARSDLFEGRAWVISTSTAATGERLEMVEEFIRSMGATPYRMENKEHDALFAAISHLPQAISISLGAAISESAGEFSLAGQGLRDMLRIADSDSGLWAEIFAANREEVVAMISKLEIEIASMKRAIGEGDFAKLKERFAIAAESKARVGGKHGARPRNYSFVNIVIDDRPGQLAAIFNECARISVNVEDLSLEHSPQQLTGLIRLALSEADAAKLHQHLHANGWRVHI
ncbi:MAG: hypothetical protein RLZZ79_963 [Actinomycetota bacterium]